MRIKYKILWVDDRKEEFEKLSYDKRIVEYVQNLFFEPQLTLCETIEEAKNEISHNHFDVIFSDYNINDDSSNGQGDSFISYIRSRNVNTEVLFYSAMNELPNLKLNRIVFFSLSGLHEGYRKLLEQMEELIYLTTEKLNDLTALRGLVMAETSELDKKMEDICLCYFVEKESEKSNTVFEDILRGLETDYLKKLKKSEVCDKKCTHKIRNKEVQEIVTNRDFGSDRKARAIKKIIEETNYPLHTHGINNDFYEAYLNDIIGTRNLLAHSHSIISETGQEVLVSKKDGNEIIFDETKIKEIRQRILLYESVLNGLSYCIVTD